MSQSPRVTGIGGVFVKARDGASLGEWYRSHLGIDVQEGGWAVFRWREHQDPAHAGTTVLSMRAAELPDYRVADLDAVLAALRREGVTGDEGVEETAGSARAGPRPALS